MDGAEIKAYAAEKLPNIKEYLRIDGNDDDSLLERCTGAALQYIIDAVGEFDTSSYSAEILLCAVTQNFYDNRELMQLDQQQRKRIEYTFGSILLQLRLRRERREEMGNGTA